MDFYFAAIWFKNGGKYGIVNRFYFIIHLVITIAIAPPHEMVAIVFGGFQMDWVFERIIVRWRLYATARRVVWFYTYIILPWLIVSRKGYICISYLICTRIVRNAILPIDELVAGALKGLDIHRRVVSPLAGAGAIAMAWIIHIGVYRIGLRFEYGGKRYIVRHIQRVCARTDIVAIVPLFEVVTATCCSTYLYRTHKFNQTRTLGYAAISLIRLDSYRIFLRTENGNHGCIAVFVQQKLQRIAQGSIRPIF